MACQVKVGIHYNRDGTKWMGTLLCQGTCRHGKERVDCVKQETDGTETLADGTTRPVKITMCVCPERFSTRCTTWLVESVSIDGERINPRPACSGECEEQEDCLPIEVEVEYYPSEPEGTVKPEAGGPSGKTYGAPADEAKVVKTRWFSCECVI